MGKSLPVNSSSVRLFLRIMARNREAYALKIAALSTALATSIVTILFSLHEFGYDRFGENANNMFRVIQKNTNKNYTGNRLSAKIPGEVIEALQGPRYRDSLVISRVKIMHGITVVVKDQPPRHLTIHSVDPNIHQVLPMTILDGDLKDFKVEHEVKAVVSSQFAETHWGTRLVAGERLKLHTWGDTLQVSIAAVFQAFPENTHEKFDILIAFDPAAIETLNFDADETGVYGRALQHNPAHYRLSGRQKEKIYSLQPITEVYFGPRILGEAALHGDRYSVIILICITSLIFFLALTTFINLITITLPYRSKELAVKKLAGTTRRLLVLGFIKESSSLVGVSLLLGLAVLICTAQFIKTILGFDILPMITHLDLKFILIVFLLSCILTASPIMMTLRFIKASPTRLLSTDTITFPSLKRYITFIQLGISIFLIITSAVIRRQINYSLVKEPGQNHDQIVYLNSPSGITNRGVNALRKGWKESNPNILDVMAVSQLPSQASSKEIGSSIYQLMVDPGFRDFFNLSMVEGHWFDPNSGDSAIVINKPAKKYLRQSPAAILGVIEDLNGHFNQPEKPLQIKHGVDYGYHWLCVRVLEVDIRRTVRLLSGQFSTYSETANVNYLSDHFKSWIDYQDRLNRLSGILTIIAALLSCCAIYALSVSLVRDKLKQIALHRLFGATTLNITIILVKSFARQLFLALIIFLPLSCLLLQELLRTFVYSTKISWIDPIYPLAYCILVIVIICALQAWNLERTKSIAALKG
jgi:putative ABC transport system permease protein